MPIARANLIKINIDLSHCGPFPLIIKHATLQPFLSPALTQSQSLRNHISCIDMRICIFYNQRHLQFERCSLGNSAYHYSDQNMMKLNFFATVVVESNTEHRLAQPTTATPSSLQLTPDNASYPHLRLKS